MFLGIFLFPSASYAQVGLQTDKIQEILSTNIEPEIPRPNEKVSIKVESFTFDLDKALISWSLNGKKQREGKGLKSFDFTVGGLGTVSIVDVYIIPGEGNPAFNTVYRFSPTDVSLIAEAKTFTPLLYRGRAIFTGESEIRVGALPSFVEKNGNTIPKENLIYTWTRDNRVVPEVSGYGKNSFSFTGSFLGNTEHIEVAISSEDGLLQGEGSLTIKPEKPVLLFYENNPLFGILYNKAITSDFTMKDTETSFTAVPYGITRTGSDVVSFHWTINGEPTQINQNGDTITVRNDSGAGGTSLIGLSIDNPKKIFQMVQEKFSIVFNKQ